MTEHFIILPICSIISTISKFELKPITIYVRPLEKLFSISARVILIMNFYSSLQKNNLVPNVVKSIGRMSENNCITK